MDERNSKNKIGVSTTSSNSSKQKSNPHIMKKSKPLSQKFSTTPKVKKLLKHRPEKFGVVVGKEEASVLEQHTYQLFSHAHVGEIKHMMEIFPNIETVKNTISVKDERTSTSLTDDIIYNNVREMVHKIGQNTHKHMVNILYYNTQTMTYFTDIFGIMDTKSCLFPLEKYKDVVILRMELISVKKPTKNLHLVGCKNFLTDMRIEFGDGEGVLDFVELEGLASQKNDCAILLFEHELNEIWKREAEEEARQRGVYDFKWKKPRASPVKLRKDLGLPLQPELLNIGEHMDKLEEHYNTHCVVWARGDVEFQQMRNTTHEGVRRKYVIEGFMVDGHMFRIKRWMRSDFGKCAVCGVKYKSDDDRRKHEEMGDCKKCGYHFNSRKDFFSHKCRTADKLQKEIKDEMEEAVERGFVMEEKTWDEHWSDVRSAVSEHRNVMLFGPGGVGKTTMLCRMLYKEMCCVFLASTGVASVQLPQGETIHRGMGLGTDGTEKWNGSKYNELTHEATQCVVIDEISMCSGCQFDLVYEKVKKINKIRVGKLGFEPISLIIVGDPAQLPPVEDVLSHDARTGFFFNGYSFDEFNENALKVQLTEVKRTTHMDFVEVQKKLRFSIIDDEVMNFLKPLCKRGRVDEAVATFICAKNEERERHNEYIMAQMEGEEWIYHPRFELVSGKTAEPLTKMNKRAVLSMVQKNSRHVVQDHARSSVLKLEMPVMITHNICVEDGIANGTTGHVVQMNKDSVIIADVRGRHLTIPYIHAHKTCSIKHEDEDKTLRILYMPLVQANALTIHKVQGLTLEYVIIDCENIWEAGQFYVALSRAVNPENVEIRNFKPEKHLKPNREVFRYLRFDEYENYCRRSLVKYDSDRANVIRSYKSDKILFANTCFYDFETATDPERPHLGHVPYFNFMVFFFEDKRTKEVELKHDNRERDICKETFDCIMRKVVSQCNQYRNAQIVARTTTDKLEKAFMHQTMSKYAKPLVLCGYNASNFDLYFIVRELSKHEEYAERFRVETIFKGRCLVCFNMTDRQTGKKALFSHDLCQITLDSLDGSCQSFVGEKVKGRFPHLFMSREFFKDPEGVLSQTFDLTPMDYPKKDRGDLTVEDLKGFNVGEELRKYGRNDTEILIRLYEAINDKVFLPCCGADVLRFATAGATANYNFLHHLPTVCHDRKAVHHATDKRDTETATKLFLCDKEEEMIVREATYGGKTLPRLVEFLSKDLGKPYEEIKDYLGDADISGMYVNIMKEHQFPFDKAYRATPKQLETWNNTIKEGRIELLMTNVKNLGLWKYSDMEKTGGRMHREYWKKQEKMPPPFFIALVDIEPHENDLEPMLGRRVQKRLLWDCSRRTGWYGSVDILIALKNGGKLYAIKDVLYWTEHTFIFHDWMEQTLKWKHEGDEMNRRNAGSGDALRAFGKLQGNATYGQNLRHDHDEVVQWIGSVEDKDNFMENVELSKIVVNLDDPDAYHLFIGDRMTDISKFLTKRSIFLGCFVLQFSRLLFNNIINAIYEGRRFTAEGIGLQIGYNDTDSFLMRGEDLDKIHKLGLVADVSGKLTDDLCSKKLKGKDKYEFIITDPLTGEERPQFGKIVKFIGTAPKCYAFKYIIPSGRELEVVKMKGISQKDMEFYDNDLGDYNDKLGFDVIHDMWHNRDGSGKPIPYEFKMPNRLTKTSVKLTKEQKAKGESIFSIKNTEMTRCLFKTLWKGRKPYRDDPNSLVPWGTVWAGESYEEGVLLPPVLRRRHQTILKECVRAWCAVTPEGGGVRTAWRQRFLTEVSKEEAYQENENIFCSGSESMVNEGATKKGNKTETEEEGLMEWQ